MQDEEIVRRIKQGDESALVYLYKKHFRMMARLVIKNSGSEDEARDVFQDALVVFWEKVVNDKFVLSSRISTFLYGVCNNLWHKELDRKGRLDYNNKSEPADLQMQESMERATILENCIASLGQTCKQLLMYYYYDRLSMSDIAEKLGFANADTAKTRKYKCKQELDKIIKSKYTASDFLD